jgi:hypothetical protein
MASQDVEVFIAGSAVWNTPVKVSDDEIRTAFDASLMTRLSFPDRSVHYLKLHMIGIDVLDGTGAVQSAECTMAFRDTDDDYLRGESTWWVPDQPDERGTMAANQGAVTFNGGTGKWAGATGAAQLLCYGLFDDPEQVVPPTGPTKYYAVFEGRAQIDAPRLPG